MWCAGQPGQIRSGQLPQRRGEAGLQGIAGLLQSVQCQAEGFVMLGERRSPFCQCASLLLQLWQRRIGLQTRLVGGKLLAAACPAGVQGLHGVIARLRGEQLQQLQCGVCLPGLRFGLGAALGQRQGV